MRRFALAFVLAAACGAPQGGSNPATPPIMTTADPQMAQMATPPDNPDSDKDGVVDDRDRCPADMEDRDGFQDDDGCPDPDNDGDGILDRDDHCPNEPETRNGYEDDDGCPDSADPIGVKREPK